MVRTEKPRRFQQQLYNVKKLLVARSLKRIQYRYQHDRETVQIQPMLLQELRRQKIPYQVPEGIAATEGQAIICFGWLLVIISSGERSESAAHNKLVRLLRSGGWSAGFLMTGTNDQLTIIATDAI